MVTNQMEEDLPCRVVHYVSKRLMESAGKR